MLSSTLTKKQRKVSSYTLRLSLNLVYSYGLSPQVTLADVEPNGSVTLSRFVAGEDEVQSFTLSASELDALVAEDKRRKSLMKRAEANGSLLDDSLGDLDDHPF